MQDNDPINKLNLAGDVSIVLFTIDDIDSDHISTDYEVDWFRGCVGDVDLIRQELVDKYDVDIETIYIYNINHIDWYIDIIDCTITNGFVII